METCSCRKGGPRFAIAAEHNVEMSITSGKFEADLFVMTNATEFKTNSTYSVPMTEVLTPDGANEVELAKTPIAGSVSIRGMEETAQTPTHSDNPAQKDTFKVTKNGDITKITFAAGSITNDVTISYFYADEAEEANIDNRSSAMGEAVNIIAA